EAAHLLVNIPEQVERVNGNVGAFDRPLQEAPEVLQAVGVDLPAHVLPRMVDHLMLIELGQLPLTILLRGISVEVRSLFDVRHDMSANSALGEVLGDGGADAAGLSVFPRSKMP